MKIVFNISIDQLELLESVLYQAIGEDLNNEQMDRNLRWITENWEKAE